MDEKRELNFEIYKSKDGVTVNQLSAENYLKKRFSLINKINYKDFKFSFILKETKDMFLLLALMARIIGGLLV